MTKRRYQRYFFNATLFERPNFRLEIPSVAAQIQAPPLLNDRFCEANALGGVETGATLRGHLKMQQLCSEPCSLGAASYLVALRVTRNKK